MVHGAPMLVAASPHQRALTEVALDILRKKPGDRILTTAQWQERLEVGSGTVQKALRQLMDLGAVSLKMKGHQGTVILDYDPTLLWNAANVGPLRLAVTPPGSIELTAIALQLREQMTARRIATEFDFVRGARRRIELLRTDQPRVAALSRVAAKQLGVLDDPGFSSLDLGPMTYYRPEALVVLKRAGAALTSARRIARDPESYDHDRLTVMQFPEDGGYEYVECPFPEVPSAILGGKADAGVWHRVVTAVSPERAGLEAAEVTWDPKDPDLRSITRAVFVWRSDFVEIGALLGLLDLDAVARAQERLARQGIDSPEVREAVPWL